METAVINSIIREFSLLSFPGSLEDEIRRHIDYQNREITFQLARIDDELKHLNKRLDTLRREKGDEHAAKYLAQYTNQIKQNIEKLTLERSETDKMRISPTLTNEQLEFIREKLKDLATRIKFEPPDVQNRLLKEFVTSVTRDQFSQNYKIQIHITIPSEASNMPVKVLEKAVYFTLD